MQIMSGHFYHVSLNKADIFKAFLCRHLARFYDPSIWSDNAVREQTAV